MTGLKILSVAALAAVAIPSMVTPSFAIEKRVVVGGPGGGRTAANQGRLLLHLERLPDPFQRLELFWLRLWRRLAQSDQPTRREGVPNRHVFLSPENVSF